MFELQTITGKTASDVYMKRWRIFGYLLADDGYDGQPIKSRLPWRLVLHKFFRPDADPDLHNHPWSWSLSFIAWGSYTEERMDALGNVEIRKHSAPGFNFISGDDYHRIIELKGRPITLFLNGPKKSSWGFLVAGKHVPWRCYLGKCKTCFGINVLHCAAHKVN